VKLWKKIVRRLLRIPSPDPEVPFGLPFAVSCMDCKRPGLLDPYSPTLAGLRGGLAAGGWPSFVGPSIAGNGWHLVRGMTPLGMAWYPLCPECGGRFEDHVDSGGELPVSAEVLASDPHPHLRGLSPVEDG